MYKLILQIFWMLNVSLYRWEKIDPIFVKIMHQLQIYTEDNNGAVCIFSVSGVAIPSRQGGHTYRWVSAARENIALQNYPLFVSYTLQQ